MTRVVVAAGIAMNQHFEGESLVAYPDGHDMAIGFGHDDANLKPGDTETDAKAKADEIADMATAGQRVEHLIGSIRVASLTDGQWAAICDFAYNAGTSPDEPIWEHILTAPNQVPSDLAQRVTNKAGVALGGLILRRRWQANMWNAVGEPAFTPPTTADIIAARAEAAKLNGPT